jgi:hypothetical protein
MSEVPIISGDTTAHMPPTIEHGGHTWRLAWVKTSAAFGQWYASPLPDGRVLLWHPSLGQDAIAVDAVAVESITYV